MQSTGLASGRGGRQPFTGAGRGGLHERGRGWGPAPYAAGSMVPRPVSTETRFVAVNTVSTNSCSRRPCPRGLWSPVAGSIPPHLLIPSLLKTCLIGFRFKPFFFLYLFSLPSFPQPPLSPPKIYKTPSIDIDKSQIPQGAKCYQWVQLFLCRTHLFLDQSCSLM